MMKRMARMMLVVVTMTAMSVGAMHAQQTASPAAPVKFQDDLFAGTEKFAKNAVTATEVTMDPQSLGWVDGKDRDKARDTKMSVVRSYKYDKPGMYDMAEVAAYRSKLNAVDWHCSVRTRNLKTGGSSDICNRSRTDGLWESAIITVDPQHLTFIHTIRTKPMNSEYGYGGGYGYGNGWMNESGLSGLDIIGPETKAEMAMSVALAVRAGLDDQGLSVDLDGIKDWKLNTLKDPKATDPDKLKNPK